MATCPDRHRFFVAEVLGVEAEGKVYVLIVCTDCGHFVAHEKQVAKGPTAIRLLREEKA